MEVPEKVDPLAVFAEAFGKLTDHTDRLSSFASDSGRESA